VGVAPEKPPVAMIMVEIVRATVKLAARTNTGPCVPDELQAIAAVHESRVGTKRTCRADLTMSVDGG
jgi:hypothetical protein